MFEHKGIWLPDGEQEMLGPMEQSPMVDGKGTYQYLKLELALKQVRRFRVALDVGAHVGFWSMHLAKRFQHVHAFEPVPAHLECFARNVTARNVTLHPCVLGGPFSPKAIDLQIKPHHSGASRVNPAGEGGYPVTLLDQLALADVDFIKLDVEGYEYHVLQGAMTMLRACRPVICIEQKPRNARRYGLRDQQALELLLSEGWCITGEMSGDFVLRPAEE